MTGTWYQAEGVKGGGERMTDTAFTGTRHGTQGAGRDQAREVRVSTSGGGHNVGVTSRWIDTLRLGYLEWISGCNRDSGTASSGDRWGGGRSRSGGERLRSRKWFNQLGQERLDDRNGA